MLIIDLDCNKFVYEISIQIFWQPDRITILYPVLQFL